MSLFLYGRGARPRGSGRPSLSFCDRGARGSVRALLCMHREREALAEPFFLRPGSARLCPSLSFCGWGAQGSVRAGHGNPPNDRRARHRPGRTRKSPQRQEGEAPSEPDNEIPSTTGGRGSVRAGHGKPLNDRRARLRPSRFLEARMTLDPRFVEIASHPQRHPYGSRQSVARDASAHRACTPSPKQKTSPLPVQERGCCRSRKTRLSGQRTCPQSWDLPEYRGPWCC